MNAISTVTPPDSSNEISDFSSRTEQSEKANATVADKVQLEILKILKDIKADMKCPSAADDNNNN